MEEIKAAGLQSYYTEHGCALFPNDANGVPFNAVAIASTGDPVADLAEDCAAEQKARAVYEKYYQNEYFDRLLEPGAVPQTRWVEGSNFADVNFKIDPRTNRVVMMGAIDNMVKGAAGQAIQNMNLMFGLPEQTGLKQLPMFP